MAKGLWMRRTEASAKKLIDYALRLGVGAVIRRLGYLMEAYGIGSPEDLARLRENLTGTYNLLDPVLPPEGISGQMADLPPFEAVYRSVRRAFRRAGLVGK